MIQQQQQQPQHGQVIGHQGVDLNNNNTSNNIIMSTSSNCSTTNKSERKVSFAEVSEDKVTMIINTREERSSSIYSQISELSTPPIMNNLENNDEQSMVETLDIKENDEQGQQGQQQQSSPLSVEATYDDDDDHDDHDDDGHRSDLAIQSSSSTSTTKENQNNSACIPIPRILYCMSPPPPSSLLDTQSNITTSNSNGSDYSNYNNNNDIINNNNMHHIVERLTKENEIRQERIKRVGRFGCDIENMKKFWSGDIGFTLFIPFDFDQFVPFDELEKESREKKVDSNHVTSGNDSNDDNDIDNENDENNNDNDNDSDSTEYESGDNINEIIIDHDPEIETIPAILSYEQMKEIHRNGLPPSVQLMTWKRVYSLSRDGDYFGTMMTLCQGYQNTLMVIKTTNGEILGGYADTPWSSGASQSQQSRSFFGSGRAFLYTTSPNITQEEKDEYDSIYRVGHKKNDEIYFYKWTGVNDYSQICDLEKGSFGMGGGGEFGWFVERDFTKGSTGRCFTFSNPPLTPCGSTFQILDLEVYGFLNMSNRLSSGRASLSSFPSVSTLGRQSSFASVNSSGSTSLASMFE